MLLILGFLAVFVSESRRNYEKLELGFNRRNQVQSTNFERNFLKVILCINIWHIMIVVIYQVVMYFLMIYQGVIFIKIGLNVFGKKCIFYNTFWMYANSNL